MNTQAEATLDISKFNYFIMPAGPGLIQQGGMAEVVNGTLEVVNVIHILGVGTLEKTTLKVNEHSALLLKEVKGEVTEVLEHKFSDSFDINLLEDLSFTANQANARVVFEYIASKF